MVGVIGVGGAGAGGAGMPSRGEQGTLCSALDSLWVGGNDVSSQRRVCS